MSRSLTPAQILHITPNDAPLTPADIDHIARLFYTPERAAAVYTGPADWARPHPVGHHDGEYGGFIADARGLWVRLHTAPARGGHVPWRDLEAVLTRYATPAAVRVLVEAVAAHRRHAGAWLDAANDPWRAGPVPYDTEAAERLRDAETAALAALLNAEPTQGALFDLEAS